MPLYPGAANSTTPRAFPAYSQTPVLLAIGDSGLCFNAEALGVITVEPVASIEFAVDQGPYVGTMPAFGVEVLFSGDPGVFEIDIQDADTDADAFFQTISGGAITSVDSNFVARVELNTKAKFIRAKAISIANAVLTTVRLTR